MADAVEMRPDLTFPALIPLPAVRSYLSCSPRTLRRFANLHNVEVLKVGRDKFIAAPELRRAMAEATRIGLGR